MFANMDYPDDDAAFAASVEQEARQQLARLGGRPALAVLCGNSEVEQQAAMSAAPRERWTAPLFHELLPQLARELCPDVPVLALERARRRVPPSTQQRHRRPTTASAHTCGRWTMRAAREVRFASECLRFANVPDDATSSALGACTIPLEGAWRAAPGWDFDDVRDHYLGELFRIDPGALRSADPRALPGPEPRGLR